MYKYITTDFLKLSFNNLNDKMNFMIKTKNKPTSLHKTEWKWSVSIVYKIKTKKQTHLSAQDRVKVVFKQCLKVLIIKCIKYMSLCQFLLAVAYLYLVIMSECL